MNVYMYQAALLCEECAAATILKHGNLGNECDDSQCCPQGPYQDGGGEADCPQHCDHCGVFLKNPLTSDGEEYVRDAYFRMKLGEGGKPAQEWRDFYAYIFSCFE